MNPFQILGVHADADEKDIKSAFRKKIKALHPDLKPLDTTDQGRLDQVHLLIEAYEILSDPIKRDACRAEFSTSHYMPPEDNHFNYREWLQEREDDESRAKLIFYDVLRNRSEEAASLYAQLMKDKTFALEKLLGREDFMDCAFMLAIEYDKQEDYLQALELFMRIGELETQRSFFRHFFIEVEERLFALLTQKITWQLSLSSQIGLIERTQVFPFHPKTHASLAAKMAELLWKAGEFLTAQQLFEKAKAGNPKDKLVKKLAKVLG